MTSRSRVDKTQAWLRLIDIQLAGTCFDIAEAEAENSVDNETVGLPALQEASLDWSRWLPPTANLNLIERSFYLTVIRCDGAEEQEIVMAVHCEMREAEVRLGQGSFCRDCCQCCRYCEAPRKVQEAAAVEVQWERTRRWRSQGTEAVAHWDKTWEWRAVGPKNWSLEWQAKAPRGTIASELK